MSAAATAADVLAGRARWCVVEGDCTDVLRGMADACVDAVVTDPPYDKRTHGGYRSSGGSRSAKPIAIVIPFAALDPAECALEFVRVSARWCVAFCALEQLGAYQSASGAAWVRAGIWHRPRAAPQFTGDRPAQAADGVAIMHRRPGATRWNGGGTHAFWSMGHAPEEEGAERGHPTRKPLRLMRELVRLFSDAGRVVLDPFAGSGTTGVAALAEGRRVILCERVSEYAAIARARCEAAERGTDWRAPAEQRSLFDAAVRP